MTETQAIQEALRKAYGFDVPLRIIPPWTVFTNSYDCDPALQPAWDALQAEHNPEEREPCGHCGEAVVYIEADGWYRHETAPACFLNAGPE
jgi:hypothetical protein